MINIFCDVIDNFGDAGVCLRLGRALCNKKEQVNLFCNDLETIKKIIKKDDTKNQYLKISLWPKCKKYPGRVSFVPPLPKTAAQLSL